MSIALPRTRSLRRVRPLRLWWLATSLALLANLAVIVGLSQVSKLVAPEPPPPLAVRSLHRQPPEPPPPPPPSVPERAAAAAAPVEVALPALSLSEAGPPEALALPTLGSLAPVPELPLLVPDFAAVAAPDVPAIAGSDAVPGVDTPAELIDGFDLDRFFPRAARLRGLTGRSRLRLAIGDDGRVVTATVLSSEPSGVFDTAAERLGRSLRFRPALSAGRAVASVKEFDIAWTIR